MSSAEPDLHHHGDAEVGGGLVNLAVNVRPGAPPPWLQQVLQASLHRVAAYPEPTAARAAVAARHGRSPAEVLLTAGAAEAFVLLARVLQPAHAVVVHPQFTEPEAALRAAGHQVHRVLLPAPFTLDPDVVPNSADLVVLGNPTNPTSVAHPRAAVRALARPGRVVVVDEAFADCLPGEPTSLAAEATPGLVVVRSLTKTWGLAGLRVGYLLAEPELVARLQAAQPLWAVSTPALAAATALSTAAALAEADAWARELVGEREHLVRELERTGVHVVPGARASFVLLHHGRGAQVRADLRARGFAPRRGDTFPGLGEGWLRVAVRDRVTSTAFAAALGEVLA